MKFLKKASSKNIHCLFLFPQILEEEKVHQKLTIGEYPLYLVPLDEDVLSFELEYSLQVLLYIWCSIFLKKCIGCHWRIYDIQECLIEGDTSSVWHVAKAIHKLEVCMYSHPVFVKFCTRDED
jgi:hypothetical protein